MLSAQIDDIYKFMYIYIYVCVLFCIFNPPYHTNQPSHHHHPIPQALDGVEVEHSSMSMDMRIVPAEVSFDGREVRDVCTEVSRDYKPSDFIVNALQVCLCMSYMSCMSCM